MTKIIYSIIFISIISACSSTSSNEIEHLKIDWKSKNYPSKISDSLEYGESYLSVYSSIYSMNEDQTHNLTATVSIRNTSENDTLFLTRASYYNTHGELIRKYVKKPIFLIPLETIEIIIASKDIAGGTGANFIFDWRKKANCPEPIFEGIMISTSGSQGISFTTIGKRIK